VRIVLLLDRAQFRVVRAIERRFPVRLEHIRLVRVRTGIRTRQLLEDREMARLELVAKGVDLCERGRVVPCVREYDLSCRFKHKVQ
jgi:hypothetical protein